MKKFWRCNVCQDIHWGIAGPEVCPTCFTKNAFVEINRKEVQKVMSFNGGEKPNIGGKMNSKKLLEVWKNFTQQNEFILNPDRDHVAMIVRGILDNEKKYGLKLCPCRLRNETQENDLELICPCNFKTHSTWLRPTSGKKPMCWCGLFVKRN